MTKTNREILAIASPAIISNITTPLLGLVDTAITGHLGSAAYIGAIAVGGSMFSMTYWLFNFLRMGTSGLTAQQYGCGGETATPFWRSLTVSFAISIILIAISPLLSTLLLKFMDADATTSLLAGEYFQIVVLGAPAVLGTYALSGWFLGMQDSKTPMWMALITNITNIAISLVLVFVFHLKIMGVAIGTMASQWIGFALGLVVVRIKYGFRLNYKIFFGSIWDKKEMIKFFSVNTDIFLRTLCLAAVTVWFTRTGASISDTVLAANAVLMQLFILFSYFMDGFAFAGEALAGKYYGKRDKSRLIHVIKGIFLWGAVLAAAFTLVYALCGTMILSVLTDNAEVVTTAQQYMPWVIAVPIAGVMAFAWDGIFIGLTMTRQMLASMAAATAAFFTVYAICIPHIGNHGLWLAFITYLALRGLIQTFLFSTHHHASISL